MKDIAKDILKYYQDLIHKNLVRYLSFAHLSLTAKLIRQPIAKFLRNILDCIDLEKIDPKKINDESYIQDLVAEAKENFETKIKIPKFTKYSELQIIETTLRQIFRTIIFDLVNKHPKERIRIVSAVKKLVEGELYLSGLDQSEIHPDFLLKTLPESYKIDDVQTIEIKETILLPTPHPEIRILWVKKEADLISEINKAITDEVIEKRNSITIQKLSYACFYINKGENKPDNIQLRFSSDEQNMLRFFIRQIDQKNIDYTLLSTELLKNICLLVLNKKGKRYTLKSLQNTIKEYDLKVTLPS